VVHRLAGDPIGQILQRAFTHYLPVVWYQVLTGRIEQPPYDFADRLQKGG
jgi:hypothetical protein